MNLAINFEGAAGADKAILARIRESYAYENGVKGVVDGLSYEIVCYGNGFEKISVKILGGTTPPVSQEDLDARNIVGNFAYCTFEGFSAKVYQNYSDKSMRVSATAKKINIVNTVNGGK